MLATPFAALAGLVWGALSTPAIGVGSQILWGSLGAFSFGFFMYLEQLLVPPLASLAARFSRGSGIVAAMLWEAVVAGGLVFLLTRVLGAPLVPAVGTALGFGAFYALVMEYVVCGEAAADVAAVLQASGGRGLPLPRQYTRAEALVQRGEYDEAIRIYSEAISNNPREGAPHLRLARVLVKKGEPEEAIEVLRRALVRAELTADQQAFVVRQIHEISTHKLGDPVYAVEDLRLLVSNQHEGPHAEWALEELRELEAGFLPHPLGDAEHEEPRDVSKAGEVERFDADPVARASDDQSGRLDVDAQRRLHVDEDFRPEEEYSLGEGLVIEEGMARDELYSSAWDAPDAVAHAMDGADETKAGEVPEEASAAELADDDHEEPDPRS